MLHYVNLQNTPNVVSLSLAWNPLSAGLSSQSFFSYHTAIHDTVKGRLASSYLTKMCPVLSRGFYDSLRCHDDEGEMELMEFVRSAMFDAVVKQLFGHQNVPQTKVNKLCRDSLSWLVEFIAKCLQFQPEVQQKFVNCRCFDYSVVVFFNTT